MQITSPRFTGQFKVYTRQDGLDESGVDDLNRRMDAWAEHRQLPTESPIFYTPQHIEWLVAFQRMCFGIATDIQREVNGDEIVMTIKTSDNNYGADWLSDADNDFEYILRVAANAKFERLT